MAKPDTFERSKGAVMHYILEFCLSHSYPDLGRLSPGVEGFIHARSSGHQGLEVGDLVVLSSTRSWSKWQIGWLREIDTTTSPGWARYLIASLEDHSLCWWENVGLAYFPRDKIAPEWRWSDRQFAFKDRWWRACYKLRDAYIVLPTMPEFGEGYQVTLGTRTRFGFDEIRPTRAFDDWRKVTKAMLLAAYDEMVAERQSLKAA